MNSFIRSSSDPQKKGKLPSWVSRPQFKNHINGKPYKCDIQVNLDWRNAIVEFQPKGRKIAFSALADSKKKSSEQIST